MDNSLWFGISLEGCRHLLFLFLCESATDSTYLLPVHEVLALVGDESRLHILLLQAGLHLLNLQLVHSQSEFPFLGRNGDVIKFLESRQLLYHQKTVAGQGRANRVFAKA